MNENGQTEAELKERIAKLERELANVKKDRARYREMLYPDVVIPEELEKPMTEAEVFEMMNEPPGEDILSILERLEKERATA